MLQAIAQEAPNTESCMLNELGKGMKLKMKHTVQFRATAWQ
jgi:cell division protein YceG involved in septum cleavage